ncbi:MAG: hypothetical protein ACRDRY_23265 [Pseudonocardiaceae bacterium]
MRRRGVDHPELVAEHAQAMVLGAQVLAHRGRDQRGLLDDLTHDVQVGEGDPIEGDRAGQADQRERVDRDAGRILRAPAQLPRRRLGAVGVIGVQPRPGGEMDAA